MQRTAGVIVWTLGLAFIALPASAASQANGIPDRLAGDWLVTQFVLGPGFGGGTFPSADAPTTAVTRRGSAVTFTEDVQIARGAYGLPEKEPFEFTLSCSGPATCGLTVKSKAWLNLNDLPLVAQADSLLAGAGLLVVGRDTLPVVASVAFIRPAGHKWEVTATGRNGKPMHQVSLTFKPKGAP